MKKEIRPRVRSRRAQAAKTTTDYQGEPFLWGHEKQFRAISAAKFAPQGICTFKQYKLG
jgi:hypothetical protein